MPQEQKIDESNVEEPVTTEKKSKDLNKNKQKKDAPKNLAPVSFNGAMSFREFVAIHKRLWGQAVNLSPGSLGHIQLMRIWNSTAIMFPEKCKDIIVFSGNDKSAVPMLVNNDLNVPELLESDVVQRLIEHPELNH